ncbi:serine/threonine protein kinase [Planctomycetota bacterium]
MTSEPNNKKRFPTFSNQETVSSPDSLTVKPDIEGYKIGDLLGEGGMGTVWHAVQISTNREVALKVTNAQVFGSKRALARFEREVELAARLEHPNIARVYDSGIHQKVYYYAMELVKGLALDDYVKERQLGQRRIIELMHTVISAIHYAHQRGIIHRDLKPSNILVTDDGQPHILDFGLAKDLLKDQKDRTVSLDGDILGTPAFMSPEQAAGRLDQIDTRSDIYSLGVILYNLLTSHWPYDVNCSYYEVLRNIQEQEPERPSTIAPHVNKDLEAIMLKSMAKDPDKRYQSSIELMDDIRNWLKGYPVKARAFNNWYVFKKFILRNRAASAVMGLLIIIILSNVFIGISSLNRARATNKELKRKEQAYQKDLQEKDILIYHTGFRIFILQWHNQEPNIGEVLEFLPQGSREEKAARFLLNPRPFSEKKQQLSDDLIKQHESFWCFIFGEHHYRNNNREEALKAYQKSRKTAQTSIGAENWFQVYVTSRITKLRNEISSLDSS